MFDFRVSPDGATPFEVEAGSRDVVRWETEFDGASLRDLLVNHRMTDFYRVAFYACKRQKLFTGTLSEFVENCELERIFPDSREASDPEPDPTPPEA